MYGIFSVYFTHHENKQSIFYTVLQCQHRDKPTDPQNTTLIFMFASSMCGIVFNRSHIWHISEKSRYCAVMELDKLVILVIHMENVTDSLLLPLLIINSRRRVKTEISNGKL